MGLDSEIVCIGQYKAELNDCMDYDYKDVPDGTLVSAILLHCSTSSLSSELANCLGVDINDVTTYPIIADKINKLSLKSINSIEWDDHLEVDKFIRLLNNGFICIFRPNY